MEEQMQKDAYKGLAGEVTRQGVEAARVPPIPADGTMVIPGRVSGVRTSGATVVGYDVLEITESGGNGREWECVSAHPPTDGLGVGDLVWLVFRRTAVLPMILAAGASGTAPEIQYRTIITGRLGFIAE